MSASDSELRWVLVSCRHSDTFTEWLRSRSSVYQKSRAKSRPFVSTLGFDTANADEQGSISSANDGSPFGSVGRAHVPCPPSGGLP